MLRRIPLTPLIPGDHPLASSAAHHVRDVLRLAVGEALELFGPDGTTARGIIVASDSAGVIVHVSDVRRAAAASRFRWIIASAVPKAARADWMIEKLSELGASAFIPLAAARSVALPEGTGKRDRWHRLATEAAAQSRRAGVLEIAELTPVDQWLKQWQDRTAPASHHAHGIRAWYLTPTPDATPIAEMADRLAGRPLAAGTAPVPSPLPPPISLPAPSPSAIDLTLLVGPEGGWTDGELARFREAGLTAVGLTATILRVETAAVTAAAVLAAVIAPRLALRTVEERNFTTEARRHEEEKANL